MIPPPPPPIELPGNVVAVVEHVRGQTARITKPEFRHALVQVAAQARRKAVPGPETAAYDRLKKKALGERLEFAWIQGQAGEMGIGVTRRQVQRVEGFLKREEFEDGAEFRRFLRDAHYTRRDFDERVEQLILTTRIQELVLLGIRGKSAQREALSKFVKEYDERWRARTVCAPAYVISRCSNAPASGPALSLARERPAQLGPPADVQLLKHMPHVGLDRLLGHGQGLGDLAVGFAVGRHAGDS